MHIYWVREEEVNFDKMILLQLASCPPLTELEGSFPQTLFYHWSQFWIGQIQSIYTYPALMFYYNIIYAYVFQVVSCLRAYRLKPCTHFHPPIYAGKLG
jgi:hypothetical protein